MHNDILTLDVANKETKRAYNKLCQILKQCSGEVTISSEQFLTQGLCLLALHADSSVGNSDRLCPKVEGPVKIKLEWKDKTEKNFTCVCFFVTNKVLKITPSGEVYIN